ncbi:ABC transporter ATP-binding protein [Desulfococcus sp.]|uniref:ABC transporter ATP-binding protein n=1 Tax=Desulfococcus sp. TaxID=2025834 RepID=UPI003594454F
MTLYSLRNLTRVYDDRTVLDIPELSMEQGRIYGLMGPNGSGKTTLLSILAFLEKPSTGAVWYHGRPVDFSERSLQPLRREIVLVNQHPIMFSTTVHRNVEFGLKIRKVPKKDRTRMVEETLDRVGMRHLQNAPGAGLSGGETQRVAIARALACSPRVILFDEPTASVDAGSQAAIESIIRDLHADRRISIVIATHNLLQASRLVEDRILLFNGRPGASASDNIFYGKVVRRNDRCVCRVSEGAAFPIPPTDRMSVSIAVHPEQIVIVPHGEAPPAGEGVFTGRIVQITDQSDGIRVVVDIGIHLSVLMRREAYASLGLRVGVQIGVYCPAHGIRIL